MNGYKHQFHDETLKDENVYRTTNKEKSYQVDNLDSNIKFLFYQQMKKWTSQKKKYYDGVLVTTIPSWF